MKTIRKYESKIEQRFGILRFQIGEIDGRGQKVKSLKAFTDEIRKAGRDDLLVAVTRQATSEYVTPDRLDEAIGIVYGKQRQKLIGE